MNRDIKIHLIGAGIGGLTAAAALQQQGFKPVLFEQAEQLGEVGAGLTIGPNASRVLTKMGLESRLQQLARIPRHTGLLHFKNGQPLKVESRGDFYQNQFGAPFWHIHRADMIDLLAGAVEDASAFRFGHRLEHVEQREGQVVTHFANGASEQCDVLIACDGLKSPIRQQIFDDSPPEFTGFVAWRGLIERQLLAEHKIEPDFSLFPGPNALVGRYAVRDRSLVNFVAIARQDDWTTEGWMEPADIDEAKARFSGWHPAVTDLFETVDPGACFKWGLHVRKPLKQWIKGQIALLGDAAHPMTPFLGLGAAMGIEDAYVLARAFAESDSPDEALSRYQSARVTRGNFVQEESQKQGLYLLNIKPGQPMDQSLTGEDPLGLYGYDATAVDI